GVDQVYQSFRNAYPGETGPRNYFRLPGYVDLDLGFGKSWKMPWSEGHELQLRWDVFNLTNTQRLTGIANNGVALDPGLLQLTAPADWSNFTQIQGNPRVMQIGARYSSHLRPDSEVACPRNWLRIGTLCIKPRRVR